MTEARPLTISDLAARTGLRPDTVRYHERVGLLPEPRRTGGDHRRYDGLAIDRLQFVRGAQRLGLRLHDIRDLLAVRDTGECPCEPAEPCCASVSPRSTPSSTGSSACVRPSSPADQLPGTTSRTPSAGRGARPTPV